MRIPEIMEEKNERLIIILAITLLMLVLSCSQCIAESTIIIQRDSINPIINPQSFRKELIPVKNTGPSQADLSVAVSDNISDFITFEESRITVPAEGYAAITLFFKGVEGKVGLFEGQIDIQSAGSVVTSIPVNIYSVNDSENVTDSKRLTVNIELYKNRVTIGKTLRYTVDIQNLRISEPFEVQLNTYIMPSSVYNNISGENLSYDENNTVTDMLMQTASIFLNETYSIEETLSLVKRIEIPSNFTEAEYTIVVEPLYQNSSARISAVFNALTPFAKRKLFGFIPYWLLMGIVIVAGLGFIVMVFVKKQMEKNKRFHVKIDFNMLPVDGERSLMVGNLAETKKQAYIDMDVLTVHTIVAGSTGGGKSISAQDIVEECLIKNCAVVVFDPTAQWSGMLRKCADKKMMSFYGNFGLSPKDARAFPGNIKAIKDYREIINLNNFFKPGEIQVFTTNTLDPKDYDLFVANTIREVFHSNLQEFRGLRYLLVYDEIHRILPKFGGSGQGFIQIERGCREFRKWGIGILLISQVLQDFVGQIKANINTQVQMKTRDEGDLESIKMKYGDSYVQELVKSPVGTGMVQNSNWNKGQPYYITFRPILHSVIRLTDEELDQYNKYNGIVDDLVYQLQQLKDEGIDVFDMELELKLSSSKIKSGNFNMVQIYLDGLTPRIEKAWDKIGKKPKKLQIKLVDEATLQADLEVAKKAKAESEAKEKEQKAAEPEGEKKEEEEKPMDPEMVKANLEALKELGGQAEEAIANKDWARVTELVVEIKSTPLPKDKKPEAAAKAEEISKKMEEAKNPPKEEKKEGEEKGEEKTQGADAASTG